MADKLTNAYRILPVFQRKNERPENYRERLELQKDRFLVFLNAASSHVDDSVISPEIADGYIKEIEDAFAVLNNDEKRALHDQKLFSKPLEDSDYEEASQLIREHFPEIDLNFSFDLREAEEQYTGSARKQKEAKKEEIRENASHLQSAKDLEQKMERYCGKFIPKNASPLQILAASYRADRVYRNKKDDRRLNEGALLRQAYIQKYALGLMDFPMTAENLQSDNFKKILFESYNRTKEDVDKFFAHQIKEAESNKVLSGQIVPSLKSDKERLLNDLSLHAYQYMMNPDNRDFLKRSQDGKLEKDERRRSYQLDPDIASNMATYNLTVEFSNKITQLLSLSEKVDEQAEARWEKEIKDLQERISAHATELALQGKVDIDEAYLVAETVGQNLDLGIKKLNKMSTTQKLATFSVILSKGLKELHGMQEGGQGLGYDGGSGGGGHGSFGSSSNGGRGGGTAVLEETGTLQKIAENQAEQLEMQREDREIQKKNLEASKRGAGRGWIQEKILDTAFMNNLAAINKYVLSPLIYQNVAGIYNALHNG